MLFSNFLLLGFALRVMAVPAPSPVETGLTSRQCRDKTEGQGSGEMRGYYASNGGRRHRYQGQNNDQGQGGDQEQREKQTKGQGDGTRQDSVPSPDPKPDDTNERQTRTSTQTVVVTQQAQQNDRATEPAPQPTTIQKEQKSSVSDSNRVGKISSADPKQLLQLHNDFRSSKGKTALEWDDKQADFAANYALDCKTSHSGGPYGENLSFGAGQSVPGLFKLWTDEEKDYDRNNPQYSHYTQVVWESTKKLGCALIACPAGTIFEAKYGTSTYLICEYDTGNVSGQYGDNV